MNNNGFNFKDMLLYSIAILVYHSTLIRFYYLDYSYNVVSGVLLFVVFLYLFTRIKIIFRYHARVNLTVLFFSICILCSSVINANKFAGSLITILRINTIFWFYEYAFMRGKNKQISFLYAMLGFTYLAITFYFIATYPNMAWLSGLLYFIGSKFYVSYIVILSLLCWLMALEEQIKRSALLKLLTLVLIVLSFAMITKVKCSTGIVGMLLVCIFLIGKPILKRMLNDWTAFCTILLVSSFILIIFSGITSIGFVSDFITNVLQKDASMSGRTIVYARVLSFILKEPIFGYGYNSVYDLFKYTMYLGNNAYALDAQNSLLEYMLYYGIIGVMMLMALFYMCFNQPKYQGEILNSDYYAYIGLYVMVILGSVEITYNMIFFTFLALVYSQKQIKERSRIE